jgi:MerR family transcriptional regulator, light-induced transcriptional regulator
MAFNSIQNSQYEFVNLLLSGNRARCSNFVADYLDKGNSVHELYECILKNALYEIGKLWEFNKISVATEHLASAIVEALLNELYHRIIPDIRINKTVIVSCVENEVHQIGLKMISDIFEMNNWNSHFLGANTPTRELVTFIENIRPDLLAISVCIYFHLPVLEKMIEAVRKVFPDLTIIVGGQAFTHTGNKILLKYNDVIYLPDLKSTDHFIKTLN